MEGNSSSGGGGPSNLALRIASAAVLGPLVLGVAYIGGWPFLVLCAASACGILWEWTRLAVRGGEPGILAVGSTALLAAMILTGLGHPQAAIALALAGTLVAGAVVALAPEGLPAGMIWTAAGVLYAAASFFGPALLRGDPNLGLTAVLFLAATVWATDIFAYFVGKAMGGPLLWPSISPRKTWAGAFGGLIGGVAAGTLVAYASGIGRLGAVAFIACTLSIIAQGGDLLESAVKRHFGAKDASHLIPGHGGLMDRLDGFLAAALIALLIGLSRGGLSAPAQGLLVW
jgi:phosphatidate cytidylyltransferase